MNKKIKTGLISLLIIIFLTFIKFLAYWFSGSLAVYSEAWHSFSDIATTFLVIVSIWISQKNNENRSVTKLDPELIIGILISIWLFIISISIFYRAIFAETININNPLTVGLVFIVISFGSFFIYRFEYATAEEENSAALKADSQHNRTDMIISLLTGFSLVLYHIGIDIDRYIGATIGIFIFLFSIETSVNVFLSLKKGKNENLMEYRITNILLSLFDKDFLKKATITIGEVLNLTTEGQENINIAAARLNKLIRKTLVFSIIGLIVYWGTTCFFMVDINERALLLRFGKLLNQESIINPGIHFKFPWPFEKPIIINHSEIRTVHIGNIANEKTALIWSNRHGDNLEFISGDNNFFLPYVSANYKIDDIKKYYLKTENGDEIVKNICIQELIKAYAKDNFFNLAIYKRKNWIADTSKKIQKRLDQIGVGITLVDLNLKDFHPPIDVASTYEDIVSATQARETMINKAKVKQNVLIPESRLYAMNVTSKASSESLQKRLEAEGYSSQFQNQLISYKEYPAIILTHLKLNAQKEALSKNNKIIYDPNTEISKSQLYSEKYIFGKKAKKILTEDSAENNSPEREIKIDRKVKRRAPIRD